jgi:hypothetical protein
MRSLFHVLRSLTRFRWYRGCRVPFSRFACPNSFSAVPRPSGPVFMFCAHGFVFGGAEGVHSHSHVSRSRAFFWPYRGRRVPFSCFVLPDSFSTVPRASSPVFMFCAPGLIFGGTEGIRSLFHVMRSLTRFQRYRGRRVPFSCFALPDSFSAVPRASGPFFMFCANGLAFGGTEGVGSRFHFLCSQTHLWRCRVCWVPFSCFACPDSFSMEQRASGPVFMFCAPGLILDGIEGVGSRVHVLRARTRFQRYRGRRVPFSCFVLPNLFSAVPCALGPVFMFCASRLIFGGTEGVGSRIHVLRSRTHFRRYRGRRVPFSCFALRDSFSVVLRVSRPVFMFCAPELIFGGTEGVGSRFNILLARTCFRRYRVRRVPFSCCVPSDSFLAVPHVSGLVFQFCAPGLIVDDTEGVGSLFHVFPSGTYFRRY